MCQHLPPCPGAGRPDREAARAIASHPEQGWTRLCNGVITFDDGGELRPAPTPNHPNRVVAVGPDRGPALHRPPAHALAG